jgi:acyl carrier protein
MERDQFNVVMDVLRTLCRTPGLAADRSLRLDSIPLLDSIMLVQAVADIERRLGSCVDFERMETIETIGDLAACFPAPD